MSLREKIDQLVELNRAHAYIALNGKQIGFTDAILSLFSKAVEEADKLEMKPDGWQTWNLATRVGYQIGIEKFKSRLNALLKETT